MTTAEPQLNPPATRGHTSVARVAHDWYLVCESKQLRRQTLSMTLLGTPLVLFRGNNGQVGALLDPCPHRNAPLSLGAVKGDCLECDYHGWQFDRHGMCQAVPGLCGEHRSQTRRVHAYHVR